MVGKPLYRWVLDTLLSIDEIDVVVINTDAATLLKNETLLKDERILLRERKEDLRGDFVSMNRILADDVSEVVADRYIMTHSTNPLLSEGTILSALSMLNDHPECDSLFSVTKHQTRFYRADGSAVNHDPANLVRTQDLEPWYEENSLLYVFTKESFARTSARIGQRPCLMETPSQESIDIDTPEDWVVVEAMIAHFLGQTNETGNEI